VLNLEDRIGNFTIQKEFDALIVDAAAAGMLSLAIDR
jgi:cytosine/adenosine deaminase-related metal-dependent hydrolase